VLSHARCSCLFGSRKGCLITIGQSFGRWDLGFGNRLRIAGAKKRLHSDAAVAAVHQGSAGMLRRANHLCRGALVAAAAEGRDEATPEYVRIAATELM
jgi:hypothetical protein